MSKDNTKNKVWDDPEVQAQYDEWMDWDYSQFSIGNYEILYRSFAEYDSSIDEILDSKAVDFLNGARVITGGKLEYSLVYNPDTHSITHCNFTMPTDNAWLGDVFDRLPWGLIKKNRTGVGATTLELKSPRNSIIVVPTRALAYGKVKGSYNHTTEKYDVGYVGGSIAGFNPPNFETYLNDDTIKYKKFMVVVDSLPRLLNLIGKDSFKDYFIMFDEIDSYQYDSWYRPNMEKAIDLYFQFPFTSRCLVSATIDSFSNPLIEKEPVINVNFNAPSPREITLSPTDDAKVATLNKILELVETHPNDKILVAYNLVTRGILPIIMSLPEDLRNECSVLCGAKSKTHVKEYLRDIVEDTLPSKITFMSCTYFVGVDFKEQFHLISVSDSEHPFTLLSTQRLQQIAGRCRHEQGLFSETIIYSTKPSPYPTINYDELKQNIFKDAELLIRLSLDIESTKDKFPKLIKRYNDILLDEIVESSEKSYLSSSKIKLMREVDGKLAISYFNIDNILIQIKLQQTLYSKAESLKDALENEGNIVTFLPLENENESLSEDILNHVASLKVENDEEQKKAIIEELREKDTLEERELLALARRTDATNSNATFLKRFIELQNYVPFEDLLRLLNEYDSPAKFKELSNAVLFWALDDNHPVKTAIRNSFKVDGLYTGDEITVSINAVWNGILGLGNLTLKQAMGIAKSYFILFEKKSVRVDSIGYPIRKYRVISLSPLGIDNRPLKVIPMTENIQKKIKL